MTSSASDSFSIDPDSGVISVAKPLDFETTPHLRLGVTATDDGAPALTGTGFVDILVVDVNDHAPRFVDEALLRRMRMKLPVKVEADAAVGSIIASLPAMDEDEGLNAALVYSLKEVDGDDKTSASDYFAIDFGEIRLVKPLDRQRRSAYELEVVVRDSAVDGPLEATAAVEVFVGDALEEVYSPVFAARQYFAAVEENSLPSAPLTTVEATGKNSGDRVRLEIVESIPAYAADSFRLDSSTGQLRLIKKLDREQLHRVRDDNDGAPDNGRNIYDEIRLIIKASYNSSSSSSSSSFSPSFVICSVTIEDENDSPPQFDRIYRGVVSEAAPIGTEIVTLGATDADLGANAALKYFMKEQGADAESSSSSTNLFAVDSDSGRLLVASKLGRK